MNLNGEWVNYIGNFDTIYNAIINIFKIIVGENWVHDMYMVVDSVGVDMNPIRNYNFFKIIIYYVLVLVFNILIFNLFVGLVVNNFRRIKDDLGGF